MRIESLAANAWPPSGENYFLVEPVSGGAFHLIISTVVGPAKNEARFVAGLRSQDEAVATAKDISEKYNIGVIYLKDQARA